MVIYPHMNKHKNINNNTHTFLLPEISQGQLKCQWQKNGNVPIHVCTCIQSPYREGALQSPSINGASLWGLYTDLCTHIHTYIHTFQSFFLQIWRCFTMEALQSPLYRKGFAMGAS